MIKLPLLIIDEISLVGNKMLSSIDCRLWMIKQVHNQFLGGLDVIMMWFLSNASNSRFMDFFIQKYQI
jgi:hypothetical protein